MKLRTAYVHQRARAGSYWLALLGVILGPLGIALSAGLGKSLGSAALFLMALSASAVVGGFAGIIKLGRPKTGEVSLSKEGATFDGATLARETIQQAAFTPAMARRPASVRLVGKNERELAWIGVRDHEQGEQVLAALGLTVQQKSAEFWAMAKLGTRSSSLFLASLVLSVALGVGGAALVGITVVLRSGERYDIPTVTRGRMYYDHERLAQASLVSRATDALLAFQRGDVPDVSARVARLGRTKEEWIARLHDREGNFREAPIRVDDLWRVVLSPAAEVTARAGAAAVLSREATEEDRARLRVAADTCAEPRLRVVLEKAASGEDVMDALGDVDVEATAEAEG